MKKLLPILTIALIINAVSYTHLDVYKRQILESAGVVLEESEDRSAAPASQPARKERHGGAFNQYSIEALNKMLEDVLAEEDYERAAKIRDEINKRKERNQ